MTTRFKREGPQKYHRTDPHKYMPFSEEESLPEALAAGTLFIVALLLLGAIFAVG